MLLLTPAIMTALNTLMTSTGNMLSSRKREELRGRHIRKRTVVGALLWTVAICGLLTVHFSHGGNNNIMWNLCVAIRS